MPVPEQRSLSRVHWSVHDKTQAPPEQVFPAGQSPATSQSVQPDAIVLQVCRPAPEHCVASSVHWSVQTATHAPPEQVSPAPQPAGDPQAVHPEPPRTQVWTPPSTHSVRPSVHASTQTQLPLEHACDSRHTAGADHATPPAVVETQVSTLLPAQRVAPALHIAPTDASGSSTPAVRASPQQASARTDANMKPRNVVSDRMQTTLPRGARYNTEERGSGTALADLASRR
jgi:hypothetical protein